MKQEYRCGKWFVEYTPEDGARLNRLCYENFDLLTVEPGEFHPPLSDYGLYETRPVYGYDDCFPSVDPTKYPGTEWLIPDHGELCWLEWKSSSGSSNLLFEVESKALPLYFVRELAFTDKKLTWIFHTENRGDTILYLQHIMHPLMKLDEIINIELPDFQDVFNETESAILKITEPDELKKYLFTLSEGEANMLFVRQIKKGNMSWTYRNGICVESVFSNHLFPTIGIWWNNSAYPNEEHLRRNECALEPVPGINSKLHDNYEIGKCFLIKPGEKKTWQTEWNITHNNFF